MANQIERCCVCGSKEHTSEDCPWMRDRRDINRLTAELVRHAKDHGSIGQIALANAFFELKRQQSEAQAEEYKRFVFASVLEQTKAQYGVS